MILLSTQMIYEKQFTFCTIIAFTVQVIIVCRNTFNFVSAQKVSLKVRRAIKNQDKWEIEDFKIFL